jgi:hypothetical protein
MPSFLCGWWVQVKGNMSLAMKLEAIMKLARKKANL